MGDYCTVIPKTKVFNLFGGKVIDLLNLINVLVKHAPKSLPIISSCSQILWSLSMNSGFRIPTLSGKWQNQMKPEEAEILRYLEGKIDLNAE